MSPTVFQRPLASWTEDSPCVEGNLKQPKKSFQKILKRGWTSDLDIKINFETYARDVHCSCRNL